MARRLPRGRLPPIEEAAAGDSAQADGPGGGLGGSLRHVGRGAQGGAPGDGGGAGAATPLLRRAIAKASAASSPALLPGTLGASRDGDGASVSEFSLGTSRTAGSGTTATAMRGMKRRLDPTKFTKTFRNGLRRVQRNKFPRVQLHKAGMDDEACELLAQALELSTTVVEASFAINDIGDAGVTALARVISTNTLLTRLELQDNKIGMAGLTAVCSCLAVNKTLQYLDISKNRFDADGLLMLAETIVLRNNTLREIKVGKYLYHAGEVTGRSENASLTFSRTRFGRKDLLFLAYSLQAAVRIDNLTELTSIDVSGNGIPAQELIWFLRAVGPVCLNVRSYDVKQNRLTPDTARDLAETCRPLVHLERIVVGQWPLSVLHIYGRDGVDAAELNFRFSLLVARKGETRKLDLNDFAFLCTAMRHNAVTTKLHVANCETLGNPCADWASHMLQANRTLTDLALVRCGIGKVGAESIAAALTSGCQLQRLSLAQNAIHNDGCAALAKAVAASSRLVALDLTECEIMDAGVFALCNAINVNSKLESLEIPRNRISDQSFHHLGETLVLNESLRTLDIGHSPGASEDGACEIANALLFNTGLKCLRMAKCAVGNDGADSFSISIKRNKTLFELDLSQSEMDWRGAKLLLDAMRRNRVLGILLLHGNGVDDATEEKLNSILSANRNFRGKYTRRGELLHGIRHFANGDELRCGRGGRHGFQATGAQRRWTPA